LLDEPRAFHAFAPNWQPLFWNLADRTAEELLNSGEEWLYLMSVLRVEKEEAAQFQAVLTEAARRLANLRGSDSVRWYDLMRALIAYAQHRRPAQERTALIDAVRQADPGSQKEVDAMAQTIAEAIFEEGREKGLSQGLSQGLTQGLSQGRAEGRLEGELQATRTLLRRLLEARFQSLPEAIIQRIDQTTDLNRLQEAVLRVSGLQKLDDLPF
jgi:flagellar biosynthesis/type III secretory pathway protein FliH